MNKIEIGNQIKKFRKQKNMSQEQLAEMLGLSVGAVSKWERSAAIPDLNYIVALADFFSVSVDVLLGYEMKNDSVQAIKDRIKESLLNKEYETGAKEAMMALQRYPNDFSIVYNCGVLFQLMGVELDDKEAVRKSIELFEYALLLLPQNTTPEISQVSIKNNIAVSYLVLDEKEKAVEQLKENNVCGINNSIIGLIYAEDLNKAQVGMEYLSFAFGKSVAEMIRVIYGYVNAFCLLNREQEALEAIRWLISYLDSIRKVEGVITYIDKLMAPCYAMYAMIEEKLGHKKEAKDYLTEAHEYAVRFDQTPDYDMKNLKYCVEMQENAIAYDDLGSTAMESVEAVFDKYHVSEWLVKTWGGIKVEN